MNRNKHIMIHIMIHNTYNHKTHNYQTIHLTGFKSIIAHPPHCHKHFPFSLSLCRVLSTPTVVIALTSSVLSLFFTLIRREFRMANYLVPRILPSSGRPAIFTFCLLCRQRYTVLQRRVYHALNVFDGRVGRRKREI